MKHLNFFIFLLVIVSCNEEIKDTSVKENKKTLASNFIKIDSDVSGIKFNNNLIDNITNKNNLFDFDYFYNGAGVGIEDLNNDGLKDIFFCGNQVPNKLYINKGNFVFEDISEKAKINNNKYWSNGVTFVDINNDGWMDIYVSQGGPNSKPERGNLLYINQKNLTFKEESKAYGLNDESISTQAAFFDFDKDGDLDCVVSNETDFYGLDPLSFYNLIKNKDILEQSATHFYVNKNGKFTDKTQELGLLNPSFGLGICVSDINNDNWLDIYISNDYYIPDALYLNNKKGGFTNEIKSATNQLSFFGMGLDIEDINNDNLNDIFVLDMASSDHIRSKTLMASMNTSNFNLLTEKLKLPHQYMFNSLQLNLGNNKFNNVVQSTKMAKSDWSWSALIFDVNNNSKEDVFITNGYRKYALDNDYKIKINKTKRLYNGNIPLDIKTKLYNELPSEKLPNILYKNYGDLKFINKTDETDLNEASFSNGAAYSDLDNDGDLDLIVNNIDSEAFVYKNMTIENNSGNYLKILTKGNLSEDFAKVTIYFDSISRTKESKRVRGYLSAVDKTIHFGLAKTKQVDSLIIKWQNNKQQTLYNLEVNKTITLEQKNALNNLKKDVNNYRFKEVKNLLTFNHSENNFDDFKKEILLPYKQSTLGPKISIGDINGDLNEDLFISNGSGYASQIFIQTDSGFTLKNTNVLDKDKLCEDMEALFIDIDNDNDNDLYVVSGGSEFNENAKELEDRLYINDGKGGFIKRNSESIENNKLSGKTVIKIDYDNDGDQDIIVGNRIIPQKYPLHASSIVYNNANGILTDVTSKVAKDFQEFGIINKIISTDFNNDGWQDFITVGEWTGIGLFLNQKGTFKNIAKDSALDNEKGWWQTVTETDVNNDGFKDYVVGNIGLNIKFNVSESEPLYVYAGDFDLNGTHDVVLSNLYNNVQVPVRGKECSTQQMPFIGEKIPSFIEFANSSLTDIYGAKILNSYSREANQFHSILLLNNGNNTFNKIILPKLAQTIPALTIKNIDVNLDGYNDLIIAGNIYNTEVETPRLDNQNAYVLISNKKDNYKVMSPIESGLYIDGNVKDLQILKHNKLNKEFLIFATNNGALKIFTLNK